MQNSRGEPTWRASQYHQTSYLITGCVLSGCFQLPPPPPRLCVVGEGSLSRPDLHWVRPYHRDEGHRAHTHLPSLLLGVLYRNLTSWYFSRPFAFRSVFDAIGIKDVMPVFSFSKINFFFYHRRVCYNEARFNGIYTFMTRES